MRATWAVAAMAWGSGLASGALDGLMSHGCTHLATHANATASQQAGGWEVSVEASLRGGSKGRNGFEKSRG